MVLGNVAVVVIGDAKIEQDIEEKGKVEDHEIKPVVLCPNNILNRSVDTKYPEWFHQQVKKKD
jgi:hypothetical protein